MSETHYSLTNDDLGVRLRRLRNAAGLSTLRLAEAASPYLAGAPQARQGHLSREALARVESGRRAFKFSEAVAIAQALGIHTVAFTSDEACNEAVLAIQSRREVA